MKKLYLVILALAMAVAMVDAQCVSKFPYSFNFETFDSLQVTSSCDATVNGDSSGGWYQDDSDGGEWRADTAGTGSTGTGPGSTDNTSGSGVGTDFSPGTTSGIYLYTEASDATGCPGNEVNLLSPCFDLPTGKSYMLSFAYHMHGTEAMGELHLDVYDGTSWHKSLWYKTGDQGPNWNTAQVQLHEFQGKQIQVRLRAVIGKSFASDIAIDAIRVSEYKAYRYDGIVESAMAYRDKGYGYIPHNQKDTIRYDVVIRNNGIEDITGVKLVMAHTTKSDTFNYGTLKALSNDTIFDILPYYPSSSDGSTTSFSILLNETDTNYSNNSITIDNYHNDSTYSRDFGTYFGGVGANTGTVEIGNIYEIQNLDTITSVSFFTNGGNAGDSVQVNLYTVVNDKPNTVIASTDVVYLVNDPSWYTVNFDCQYELKPGKYFVSVRQLVQNVNMGLGYTTKRYEPNMCLYSGAGWPEMNLGNNESVLVRMNLGKVKYPDLGFSLADSICENTSYVVTAQGANTYNWAPLGIINSKSGATVRVRATASFTVSLTGVDKCGLTSSVSQAIFVDQNPSLQVSNDTTVCQYQSVLLKATTGADYRWIGGTTNTNYGVNPGETTTYTVIADSSNGCSSEKSVTVNVSIPEPNANNDTTLCEKQLLRLQAYDGTKYEWMNGPSTQTYDVYPTTNSSYIVKVTDTFNCSSYDTVNVTVIPGPPVTTTNDTSVCFGNRIFLEAFGADTYKWEDGPTTSGYNALPISTKAFKVQGTDNTTGCYIEDSVVVTVVQYPSVTLPNDTTICEGKSLTIDATSGDQVTYQWRTGQTTKNINVSPTQTTTYLVEASNTTGCSNSDSMMVTVDPLPVIDFGLSQNHKIITITNSSVNGDTHLWTWGDGDSTKSANTVHRYDVHGNYNVTYTITNDCGSKDTSFVVMVENISVEDVFASYVNVYPIPSTGMVTFEAASDEMLHSIQIVDQVGRVVYQSNKTEQRADVDLSGMATGMYMSVITIGENKFTVPILIQ